MKIIETLGLTRAANGSRVKHQLVRPRVQAIVTLAFL